jgi:hypothetical protein
MKIILSGQIDHLNFENVETIHNIRIIRVMYNTIVQFYIDTYVKYSNYGIK